MNAERHLQRSVPATSGPVRRAWHCWLPACLAALAAAGTARAEIELEVEPMVATVGEPVLIFGSADCETFTVDVGDGTPPARFDGPGPFTMTHVYTEPGVYQVLLLGTACVDGIDNQVSTVVVNPDTGEPPGPLPESPIGTLSIVRLGLRFENDRPEVRVLQNQKGVQVFADIRFAGTGLLQGYWEVDGVIRSFVNRHLVFGNRTTIASPPVPGLPTIVPGIHRVRLVLTRPAAGFTPPVALYFAGYHEALSGTRLRLMRPRRGARIAYAAQSFEWASSGDVATYRLSFFDADRRIVLSALTRSTRYELPDRLLEDRFVPGRRYEWQIAAYDGKGEPLVRSLRRPFTFEAPAEQVAGQVIVGTEWSIGGAADSRRAAMAYGLRKLRSHRLESLDLEIALFETPVHTIDVHALARRLEAEEGVVLAEPNFVLRALGEPSAEIPTLRHLLDLDGLHEQTRGRRVRVALIDTGIDAAHADLQDRIFLERNFAERAPLAAERHGTAVAGIIAAGRGGAAAAGVAPDAQLLVLRACRQLDADSAEAVCESFDVARAIDAALVERAHIVNMSFGGAQDAQVIERLIEKGREDGVWFVAPVGNAKWRERPAFPARHPAVIGVGGYDESGRPYLNQRLYAGSSVTAPAINLLAAAPGGGYTFVSGTSFASAAVTGVLALAIEERSLTGAEDLPRGGTSLCTWTEQLMRVRLPCAGAPADLARRDVQVAGADPQFPSSTPGAAARSVRPGRFGER